MLTLLHRHRLISEDSVRKVVALEGSRLSSFRDSTYPSLGSASGRPMFHRLWRQTDVLNNFGNGFIRSETARSTVVGYCPPSLARTFYPFQWRQHWQRAFVKSPLWFHQVQLCTHDQSQSNYQHTLIHKRCEYNVFNKIVYFTHRLHCKQHWQSYYPKEIWDSLFIALHDTLTSQNKWSMWESILRQSLWHGFWSNHRA